MRPDVTTETDSKETTILMWAIGISFANKAIREACELELSSLGSSKPQNCSA